MTNREAVIAEVQIEGYSENAIIKALIFAGLNADDAYTVENDTKVAVAAIKVLNTMLGVKSIQEGGYQITYSINERIAALNEEYGLVEKPMPTVRARNVW